VQLGEVHDLRIMSEAADRKVTEVKNELKHTKTVMEKEIEHKDTKVKIHCV